MANENEQVAAWIQTFTGKKFFPLHPSQNEYDLRDIAHALSLKCRFGGHCNTFYSVAEHSVRVSQIVAPESQLAALMHDAAEAYLPDVPSPVKGKIGVVGLDGAWCNGIGKAVKMFGEAEASLMLSIAAKFEFPNPSPEDVKLADLMLLATEARDLMSKPPESWNLKSPMLAEKIEPWTARDAEREFLRRFAELNQVAEVAGTTT